MLWMFKTHKKKWEVEFTNWYRKDQGWCDLTLIPSIRIIFEIGNVANKDWMIHFKWLVWDIGISKH